MLSDGISWDDVLTARRSRMTGRGRSRESKWIIFAELRGVSG